MLFVFFEGGIGPCIPEIRVAPTTNCTCQSGSKLTLLHQTDGTSDTYICQSCPKGKVIDSHGSCGRCPKGQAAIPGIFIKEWPKGNLPSIFKTECSGNICAGVSCVTCYFQFLSYILVIFHFISTFYPHYTCLSVDLYIIYFSRDSVIFNLKHSPFCLEPHCL